MPISNENPGKQFAAVEELLTHWLKERRDLLSKYTLTLASDWDQFRTSAGIPCGSISGLVAETRPVLEHDPSTNALIRFYRRERRRP